MRVACVSGWFAFIAAAPIDIEDRLTNREACLVADRQRNASAEKSMIGWLGATTKRARGNERDRRHTTKHEVAQSRADVSRRAP
jgi:hypothetical protein